MFNPSTYEWDTEPITAEIETHKADLRIPSGAHEIVSRCSATMETNEFQQSQCKWYRPAPGDSEKVCTYDRFGIMCDKIVVDKKGVN